MSVDNEARLAVAHAHRLASSSASLVGLRLGVWCGNGDYASWSPEFRDQTGVRALAELDAAITQLAAVREQLAQAIDHDDATEATR